MAHYNFIARKNPYVSKPTSLGHGNPFKQITYTELEHQKILGNYKGEWNQLLASRKKYIHGAFANGYETYSEIRPLYQARGINNPSKYLIDNIIAFQFFGHKTTGHIELADRLRVAEKTLRQKSIIPVINKFWSFNPRSIRGSKKLSKHALGRALDINPDTNPHIINKDDINVIYAVTGINLGRRQSAPTMQQASQVFKSQFNQQWINIQSKDLQYSISGRRQMLNRYAKLGFMNLEQSLIDALKGAGIKWGGDWIHVKDFMHFEL